MMENYQTLTSPDGSRNTPERCPCPLYSWDSSQEHQVISEEDQNEDSIIVEVKEEVEDTFMTDDKLYKEEEVISPEISTDPGDSQRNVKAEEWDEGRVRIKEEEIHIKITTDGSSNRNTPERSPHPLCSQDSPQEHQAKNVLICKAEVKEEAEYPSVMDSDPCKEEEIPSEISTGMKHCILLF
ncbi:uncharacterized protein [Pyxicephalus adspersus]|uniref:uncharacterized protein isoform X2 n=1 Tax=Pyxicephalus adspersus TaxID=30357 RepID=UPI003B5AA03A